MDDNSTTKNGGRNGVLLTSGQARSLLGVSAPVLARIVANGDLAPAETTMAKLNLRNTEKTVAARHYFRLTDVERLRAKIEQKSYNPYRWTVATGRKHGSGGPRSPKLTGVAVLNARISKLELMIEKLLAQGEE